MTGPLDGVRVVDLTTILLGPIATQILADMGADVVKVEAPDGDAIREVGPPPANGMGAVFLATNRNKRSVVLDLKQAGGRDALLRICAGADVFVHNMRPQAIERLDLGYQAVAAVEPSIVYCATYGFRARGPYGAKPAYDDMIQAASGLAALQGAGGPPAYVTSAIADKITGLTVVYAVAMALFHRARTGEGQAIEVPMFETLVSFNFTEHLYGHVFEPARGGLGYPRTLSTERRPYATRDGYVGVLPYTDKQWRALFEAAGRSDLAEDERFNTLSSRLQHVDALYAELAALLRTRTTAQWLDALDEANVPAMAVRRPEELERDPHLDATGFWARMETPELGTLRLPGVPVTLSRTPGRIRRPPPHLGEHSEEVLNEAGLSADEVEALLRSGATRQWRRGEGA